MRLALAGPLSTARWAATGSSSSFRTPTHAEYLQPETRMRVRNLRHRRAPSKPRCSGPSGVEIDPSEGWSNLALEDSREGGSCPI